jgi:dihydrofolate reductase
MRKVILFILTSLDGYFEGPNADISWHNVDDEFNEFAIEQLDTTDLLLFGRVTYELMAGYWLSPDAMKNDPIVAERMNSLAKIVFSKSISSVTWQNTLPGRKDFAAEISNLKQQPGKDIFIFGSSDLAVSLLQQGLIDEFRVMVNPVVLGKGKALFEGIERKLDLKLIKTRLFKSGNVLLYYTPAMQ